MQADQRAEADTWADATRVYGEIRADGVVWCHEGPRTDDCPAWTWHHLDLVNARARATAEHGEDWAHAVRQVLVGQDETPRILVYGDVVAGVLPSYGRAAGEQEHDLVYWHFVAIPERLVTGRRHAARSLATAYHAFTARPAEHGPASAIGVALIDFARSARARLASLAGEMDRLEDDMLDRADAPAAGDMPSRLGQMRREAVALRRAVAPLIRGLDADEEELPAWFDGPELDGARSALHGVLDDITAMTERARSLQDELTSRLADETNRRLYLVSIVTALVMPATLVTGFFGMNTGGLIWGGEEAHYGTIYAAITCVAAVVAMLALLRWRRLL